MSKQIIKNWDSLPVLLSMQDVSNLLNCSIDQARTLARNGVIPAKKLSPKKWVVPKDLMQELIEG